MPIIRKAIQPTALTALFFLLHTPWVHGAMDFDPKPPLRWPELVDCEWVIAARYHSHKDMTLALEVLRVLKGKDVKPGDVIKVALTHRYSIETGPVGWDALMRKKVESYPKLCYLQQLMNPGGLHPVPLGPDVREPNLYFLPKAAKPALERTNQVKDVCWEEGWRQAVQRRPMDLHFRLLQTESPSLARDALEELYESRDPATMNRLAEALRSWAWRGPGPEEKILVAVGQHKRDVYDLVGAQWRKDVGDHYAAAPAEVERLMHQLGNVRSAEREAAHRALAKMGEPILPIMEKAAVDSRDAEIRRRAELLAQAIESRAFDEERRNKLYVSARVMAQLDRERTWLVFQKTLETGPKAVQRQVAHALQYVNDERALRLAFKLLKESDMAQEAILSIQGFLAVSYVRHEDRWYHRPLPSSLARFREIAKPEVQAALAGSRLTPTQRESLQRCLDGLETLEKETKPRVLRCFMQTPANVEELCRWVSGCSTRGLKDARLPPALVAELCKAIELGPWPGEYLGILFHIDAAKAEPLLERALCRRNEYQHFIRGHLLAVGVRYGRKDLVDELIRSVRISVAEERRNGQGAYRHRVLLLANDPRAYAEYLRLLDEVKRLEYWHWGQQQRLAGEYYGSLASLFPTHARDFFERVLALLESNSLPEREAGEELLRQSLKWTFGYDSFAFAQQRSAQLAGLRPILHRLADMSPVEMRAFVLRELGVKLSGRLGRIWAAALREAACGDQPAVVENSLLVLDEVIGAHGCHELHDWPTQERGKALAAFFRRIDAKQ